MKTALISFSLLIFGLSALADEGYLCHATAQVTCCALSGETLDGRKLSYAVEHMRTDTPDDDLILRNVKCADGTSGPFIMFVDVHHDLYFDCTGQFGSPLTCRFVNGAIGGSPMADAVSSKRGMKSKSTGRGRVFAVRRFALSLHLLATFFTFESAKSAK